MIKSLISLRTFSMIKNLSGCDWNRIYSIQRNLFLCVRTALWYTRHQSRRLVSLCDSAWEYNISSAGDPVPARFQQLHVKYYYIIKFCVQRLGGSILKVIASLTKSFFGWAIFAHLVNHHVVHHPIPRILGVYVPDTKFARVSLLK